jgi:hypothetical protein
MGHKADLKKLEELGFTSSCHYFNTPLYMYKGVVSFTNGPIPATEITRYIHPDNLIINKAANLVYVFTKSGIVIYDMSKSLDENYKRFKIIKKTIDDLAFIKVDKLKTNGKWKALKYTIYGSDNIIISDINQFYTKLLKYLDIKAFIIGNVKEINDKHYLECFEIPDGTIYRDNLYVLKGQRGKYAKAKLYLLELGNKIIDTINQINTIPIYLTSIDVNEDIFGKSIEVAKGELVEFKAMELYAKVLNDIVNKLTNKKDNSDDR